MNLESCGGTLNTSLQERERRWIGIWAENMARTLRLGSGLTLLFVGIVFINDAAAGAHQFAQRFGDSALQGFKSRMSDSAIQRFDSRMRNSMTQRFESRMLQSPVHDFNSQMLNSAIQRFHSQMMYSPAQRVEGPWKSFRPLISSFFLSRRIVEETIQEQEILPEHPSQPIAPPQFISLRCGIFTEMTISESEILSEKEEAPCDNSGEAQDE
jgi:hypothetical protein